MASGTRSREQSASVVNGKRGSTEPLWAPSPAQPDCQWLPPRHAELLMPDGRVKPFIDDHKGRHWFLAFAHALFEREDRLQSKMLAKAYAFLYDFIPHGFVHEYSHINGRDVMNIVLCEKKEMAVSRHKATQNAQANFDVLEAWMKKGSNWRAAAQAAQAAQADKKKGPRKVPFLYSPEGLIALLIVAYPDQKWRELVVRLELDWILSPRDKLAVRRGFWAGLTGDDLTMFQTDEPRVSDLPLALDYRKILGKDFVRAREDIRPFLPTWAAALGLCLSGEPAGLAELSRLDGPVVPDGSSGPDGSDQPRRTSAGADRPASETIEVLALPDLGEHLSTGAEVAPAELQGWLLRELGGCGEEGVFLPTWCKFWVEKMDGARHYRDQVILQSLFIQSIRRLYSLSRSADAGWADIYMLLDMEDNTPRTLDAESRVRISRLQQVPSYRPLMDAKAQLLDLARDQSRRDHLRRAFDEQMSCFDGMIKDQILNQKVKRAINFDAARTRTIIRAAAPPSPPSPAGPIESSHVTSLLLTKWQLRGLAVAELGAGQVLTDSQARIYQRDAGRPLTPASDTPDVVRATEAVAVGQEVAAEKREMLRKLFGDLSGPYIATHGGAYLTAQPRASQRSVLPPKTASPAPGTPRSLSQKLAPVARPSETPRRGPDWNPFNGVTSVLSKKRAGSPDTRHVKASRQTSLNGEDLAEMRQSMASTAEQLRAEFNAAVQASREDTLASMECRWAAIRAQVLADAGQITDTKLSDAAEALKAQALDRVQSLTDRFEEQLQRMNGLDARVRSLEAASESGDATDSQGDSPTQALKEALEAQELRSREMDGRINTLQEELDALKLASDSSGQAQDHTAPVPGQDGYLTARCPAPAEMEQKAYESVLIRAVWFYVASLPTDLASILTADEGFDADGDAFSLTMQNFAMIDGSHLLEALQHVHWQSYNRPFHGIDQGSAVPASGSP